MRTFRNSSHIQTSSRGQCHTRLEAGISVVTKECIYDQEHGPYVTGVFLPIPQRITCSWSDRLLRHISTTKTHDITSLKMEAPLRHANFMWFTRQASVLFWNYNLIKNLILCLFKEKFFVLKKKKLLRKDAGDTRLVECLPSHAQSSGSSSQHCSSQARCCIPIILALRESRGWAVRNWRASLATWQVWGQPELPLSPTQKEKTMLFLTL